MSLKFRNIFNDYYVFTINATFLYNPSKIIPSIKYIPNELLFDNYLSFRLTFIFKNYGDTFSKIVWRAMDAKIPF